MFLFCIMKFFRFILVILFATFQIQSSEGHTLHLGRTCPDVQAFPNLSLNKVLGEWYVLYKTDTGNACLLWNMTRSPIDDEQIFIKETRQLSAFDLVGIDHTHSITATATIPNIEIPSRLRIKWPYSAISGEADFTIFDTDYENYMAIFECNRAGIVHRRSAVILARKPNVDYMFIRRVRRLLETADVSHSYLSEINHNGCRKNPKRNWSVGEPNLKDVTTKRRVADVEEYDLSEIEIIGDDVSPDYVGTFRGSIKEQKPTDI